MAAALLLLGALLCPGRAALAHAALVGSEPAAEAHLATAPARVVLRFDEPILPLAFKLVATDGGPARLLAAEGDGDEVTLELPPDLASGWWLVSWRVASADNHPIGGTLRFGIGAAGDPGALPAMAPAEAGRWHTALVATRFAHHGLLVAGLGLGLTTLLAGLKAPALSRAARALTARLAPWGMAAAPLLALATGLDILAGEPGAILTSAPWRTVAALPIGSALLASVLAQALLLLGSRAPERPTPGRAARLATAGGIVLGLTALMGAGHAATSTSGSLFRVAFVAHVGCAALWVGAILALRPAVSAANARAAQALDRASAVLRVGVPLLLVAGAVLAALQLGGVSAETMATAYGRLLLVKTGFVLLVGLVGLMNLQLTARWPDDPAGCRTALRRTLLLDAGLVAAVLAVTAALACTAPPRSLAAARTLADHDHGRAAGGEAAGFTVLLAAGGYRAQMTLEPGRIGSNSVLIEAFDAQGRPAAARDTRFVIAAPDAGIEPQRLPARPIRAGAWLVEGVWLTHAGRWQVRCDLLVDDFTKVILEGPLDLPPP